MKKILILANADPNSNPRPNRMIHWLKGEFDLTIVARSKIYLDGIQSYAYHKPEKLRISERKINYVSTIFRKIDGDYLGAPARFILRSLSLLFGYYEKANWLNLGTARSLIPELSTREFDLIISHDLVLLPLAFQVKAKHTKIILDAREYYPRNFDDDLYWRLTKKPVNEYLCNRYLEKCDKVLTVSPGLVDEYKREFNIDAELLMSLPHPHSLIPSTQKLGSIRMIHHGNANPSRKTELMIEMMDYVDERFTLDLMLVVTDVTYWNKIVAMAEARKNVRVIPPVPMQDIVETINHYDVGLYLAPPGNFNIKFMLPNKLFEFIQARLAVAIGPSIEMRKIVEQYQCGIVSQEFSPQSLAKELNQLTVEKLDFFKQNAHQAALKLNADINGKRIIEVVDDLLATNNFFGF
jgi:hypothetical protein